MLDVRRLRTLHAVAAHRSVSAAARSLGFTASAVSQQLAALERDVGVALTERDGRGIVLTAAADVLVAHTDELLSRLDAAEADVAAFRDAISGQVTLAAFPTAAATLVPSAWADLRASAPHVDLSFVEMEPDESLPAVQRGLVDVAVAHEYDNHPQPLDPIFERRPLLSDPVLIAVPRDHPAGSYVDLGSLREEPFVTPRPDTTCAEMTQRACASAGFSPRIVARATDFQVLLGLVEAGIGVALIPRLAARHVPAGVRLVDPQHPITRAVFTVSRRGGDRKPAVRVVLDALCASAACNDERT